MYDRRNICAARTRIGHRALRERRPPPRGTRGTVTAVACPRISSLSFPSTAGASVVMPRAFPRDARLPTRHAARHAVACSGPAVRPSSWPTPDRPTHLVMPGLVPGISLRQASSRVRGPMDGRIPGTKVRAGPAMTWQGAPRAFGGLFRTAAGPGCEAARTARLRQVGTGEAVALRRPGRRSGRARTANRRAEWRVGKRAELAPAVEGNERRHIRHIFRAGFAGIKWD